jgi:hypothetical protein
VLATHHMKIREEERYRDEYEQRKDGIGLVEPLAGRKFQSQLGHLATTR